MKYLLQAENVTMAVYFICALVGIGIFYLIIKRAVKAGNERLYNQLYLQNRLTIEKMKQDGVPEGRISELVNKEIPG